MNRFNPKRQESRTSRRSIRSAGSRAVLRFPMSRQGKVCVGCGRLSGASFSIDLAASWVERDPFANEIALMKATIQNPGLEHRRHGKHPNSRQGYLRDELSKKGARHCLLIGG